MAMDALDWAGDQMCVTFTRGLDPAEVFTRYGADPARSRLLDADAASDLPTGQFAAGAVSLLRSGRLGDWTFCVEEDGVIGSWPEVLAALSRGTETYGVLSTEGLAVFQHWRDGQCLENFEPDLEQPPSEHPGPWWDRVQEALAEGEGFGMAPVVALVLDHLGLALDDATLAAPWPTLTVAEDDAPSAPRGDSYAGEGPVPPGAIEIL
ncbi:DUF6461 domain-containing protein [Streptomyces griseomycini]|uniref:Uncharacterized protein n=1 Tax=Streptomyces griseomycini TaxID=66895 RepID=A0A7W7PUT8_9ACTN|nr:DUF6461 domain-containing protein [Streptomyces griseomycini]MBB4901701.1 hypothetical protein [Streptomyces griseomycini]GGR49995.1 hypothetical protein GCM10015536_64510 [Streptomyces griseomycini]